jgi:hypothetical protein
MALQFSTTVRNNRLDQISTSIGANGHLIVYTGSAPGVGNASTGTKLCTLTAVTFASASGGTKTFTATNDSNAAASGTPGYARLTNTAESTVYVEFDAAVGSGTLNFNATVSSGGTVSLSSATITEGNA